MLNPVNMIWLIILLIIFRIGIFLQMPESFTFNFGETYTRLLISTPGASQLSPSTNIILASVFVLIQALLVNKLVNHYNLLSKPTFLPALMYITGSSIFVPFMILSPALLCNFLTIWLISKLIDFYKGDNIQATAYDSGMITALGTIIYFPYIFIFLAIWISLIIFRPFNWREWAAAFIGFLTIFFFLAVYYYWNDHLSNFYQIWLPLKSQFPVRFQIDYYNYLVLIPVILILALSVFRLNENFLKSYVQTRKAFQLLFFVFIIAALSFYINPFFRLSHFILCLVPLSIIMGYYFLYAKKRWFYESLYILLFISVIYFQFNKF
jgi:hypothetical protein